ncbi:MAG: dipeptidase [Anaerolineales bacterium]|jgi:acetylornithine deacetylase/succinyl-diaminopimelate desuccinylase-like protein
MTEQLEAALQYAHENQEGFLSAYKEILGIPSVSTDPAHAADIRRAAEWLVTQLRSLGMQKVQIFPTPNHPIVYGEWLQAKSGPTVLIYGHYDVQPADPLDLWETPPFDPTVIGENIFARGASDMKGQALITLKAVEALVRTGGLPVNIKWLFEGEEEIGSPDLEKFIDGHRDLLSCDFALNPDAGMLGAEFPTITYTLRGLAYFELRVYGPAHDLHSGIFGGVVHNPANALAELIAGMHDSRGRVTLPGFYERVRPLSKTERAELARLPTDEQHYLEQTGAPRLYGEKGYTPNERTGARPTLDVNGMLSGFTGGGSKTVIPAWAMAKISMRLVPDQDPQEVHQQLLRYLEQKAAQDIRWEVIPMSGGPASISDRNNAGVRAMEKALASTWGRKPLFRREGGSIPVVSDMQRLLGVESVVAGFGLPDDNVHAPNEKQHLPTWHRGIEALIRFFLNLGPA